MSASRGRERGIIVLYHSDHLWRSARDCGVGDRSTESTESLSSSLSSHALVFETIPGELTLRQTRIQTGSYVGLSLCSSHPRRRRRQRLHLDFFETVAQRDARRTAGRSSPTPPRETRPRDQDPRTETRRRDKDVEGAEGHDEERPRVQCRSRVRRICESIGSFSVREGWGTRPCLARANRLGEKRDRDLFFHTGKGRLTPIRWQHVYKQSRRREYERLKIMDEEEEFVRPVHPCLSRIATLTGSL